MSDVKSYFEENTHNHAYHNDPDVYRFIVTMMNNERFGNTKTKILDIGCVDGAFIKSLLSSNINAEFTGTDISQKMKDFAKKNINNNVTLLMVSDAFNMLISQEYKFDLIHMDSVLHHLIGRNRDESKTLADKLLQSFDEYLTKDGKIIVEELYYASYLFEQFTSICIFYCLKILNKLGLDIHKIMVEFHKGLEVRSYSEKEFTTLLQKYGNPAIIRKKPWKVPRLYKLFLLKRMEHVTYLVSRR